MSKMVCTFVFIYIHVEGIRQISSEFYSNFSFSHIILNELIFITFFSFFNKNKTET